MPFQHRTIVPSEDSTSWPAASRCRNSALLLALCLVVSAASADRRVEFDHPMYSDPLVKAVPVLKVFPPGLAKLWSQALGRNEAELQHLAAESIIRAHREGMKGLEVTIPVLRETLERTRHPVVKLAVGRALLELEDKESFARLLSACKTGGLELVVAIEPQLGKHQYAPMRDVWLKRLGDSETTAMRQRVAIRGLVQMKEKKAIPALLAIVKDAEANRGTRLSAARGLAQLGIGLERDILQAWSTAEARFSVRLLAAFLAPPRDETLELLQRLALDSNSAVSRVAAQRLATEDPQLLRPLTEKLKQSPDAMVRIQVAVAWAHRPDPKAIENLRTQLADLDPEVRNHAREQMLRLARDQWSRQVDDNLAQTLGDKRWQALEQAVILAAQLKAKKHAPAVSLLVHHDRPEVFIAAAWSARTLQDPATLPVLRSRVQRILSKAVEKNPKHLDAQVCHIFQAFGLMNYRPGNPQLDHYIRTKQDFSGQARAAAVWARGRIAAKSTAAEQVEVGEKFIARIEDPSPLPAELEIVQRFAAQEIARLRLNGYANKIRHQYIEAFPSTLSRASYRWSFEKLTGLSLGKEKPRVRTISGWFIEPLKK